MALNIPGVTGETLVGSAVQIFDTAVPLERYTEYQRDYNWEILFPRSVGLISGIAISKYCKRVAFGNSNIERVGHYQVGAKKKFVPEGMVADRMSLTFLSPFPDLVQDYFVKWRDMTIGPSGDYSVQSSYKMNVFIQLYTQQGITSNILHVTGVFPVKVPSYNLAYANEDILKYEITLSMDDLMLKSMDIGGMIKTTIPRVLGSYGKKLF